MILRRHFAIDATTHQTLTKFILVLFVYLCCSTKDIRASSSSLVSMLSRGQLYQLTAGGKIALDCEFHMGEFKMFDNPILWEKYQRNEKTRINIMGVVQEPFATTRRFEVDFNDQPPRYRMRLQIRDVSILDSGNYTCEVRGKKSMVLASVTHSVYVRGPLTSLYLTSDVSPSNSSRPLTSITATDGQPIAVSCVSQGPCPPGVMALQIGEIDVTHLFLRGQPLVEVSGVKGLRSIECVATRWNSMLTLKGHYDGKNLRCIVASSPGIDSNWTHVTLQVYYAPLIRCKPSDAQVGEEDVQLECRVRSRPDATVLYWVVDANGTTLSKNEVANEYFTSVRVDDDDERQLITRLCIGVVTTESFRKYTLVAENVIGSTTHITELVSAQRMHSPSSPKRTVWEQSNQSHLERSSLSSSSSSSSSSSYSHSHSDRLSLSSKITGSRMLVLLLLTIACRLHL